MSVDYNSFAKTFSQSRKSMRWEEIDYFLDKYFSLNKDGKTSILDVGCGSGRLLKHIIKKFPIDKINYVGIDLSSKMLDEAKKEFPDTDFWELDMRDLDKIKAKGEFDYIFFIASFHHLQFMGDREEVLREAKTLLKPGGLIFMTNWALDSEFNYKKYTDAIIEGSENEFGSRDYNIYIGEYPRYYHCFNLKELEALFKLNNFEIIENREFDNKKNRISIIKKI